MIQSPATVLRPDQLTCYRDERSLYSSPAIATVFCSVNHEDGSPGAIPQEYVQPLIKVSLQEGLSIWAREGLAFDDARSLRAMIQYPPMLKAHKWVCISVW